MLQGMVDKWMCSNLKRPWSMTMKSNAHHRSQPYLQSSRCARRSANVAWTLEGVRTQAIEGQSNWATPKTTRKNGRVRGTEGLEPCVGSQELWHAWSESGEGSKRLLAQLLLNFAVFCEKAG